MGQSTNAYLVYGINIDEENPYWEEEEPEEALNKAVEEAGLELLKHCSNSHALWIVCMPTSVIRAWRGCPVKVDDLVKHPNNMHTADNVFARAKKKLPWLIGEPAWLLCSFWET